MPLGEELKSLGRVMKLYKLYVGIYRIKISCSRYLSADLGSFYLTVMKAGVSLSSNKNRA